MGGKTVVFVLFLSICAYGALASDENSVENVGVRIALKLYDDCSKSDAITLCLKKKAVTFLDRLRSMDKLSLAEGVTVKRAAEAPKTVSATINEDQLEQTLPRSADAKDEALNNLIVDKVTDFIGSRTLEVSLPRISPEDLGVETGRKGSGGGGGGGGGGKKGGMGMMGGMMMGIAAKMVAMIPVAIAGLFLLAGKALITAKIALLISGIIAIKKLFASKQGGGGGGGGHGGWQSSGHGGGWQSSGGGGGGWDKRSLDAQNLAYKGYNPK